MTIDETSTLHARTTMRGVDRRLLRNDVYELLLERILTGGFSPGERLKDAQLTDWLLVSRTPVREALSRLAVVGLVTSAPNRYTLVAPLAPGDIADALGILRVLYPDAVASAIARLSGDLEIEYDLLAARLDRDPLLHPVEMLRRVLGLLLGSIENRVLAETIESVQLRVLRYLYVSEHSARIVTNERVAKIAGALGARGDDAVVIMLDLFEEISALVERDARN
ncbi:GntR family transcriptional regulator [Leifsonia sp. NPDC058230]|uniref:GntR family transcriptional regulator n=1 Tax=Leifsonia sp. NPDC058230 TaxID=3346391 RepID=UPI0036DA56AB